MTCENALEAMSAVLDGEATAEERVRFERHIDACGACARRYARLLVTQQMVRSAAPDWSQPPREPARTAGLAVSMAVLAAAAVVVLAVWPFLPEPPPVLRTVPAPRPSAHTQDEPARPPIKPEIMLAQDCRLVSPGPDCQVETGRPLCESPDDCSFPSMPSALP